MIRYALCIAFLFLGFTAHAETPPLALEWILDDQSKPPAERSVAIVVGLHRLANQAMDGPAVSQLDQDARNYALTLKAHGGFDTIILLEDEAVTNVNVRRVLFSVVGDGKAFPAPKYLLFHWAGPALDNYSLMTYDNNSLDYNTPGGMPIDMIEIYLGSMKSGHVVVSFDTPPGPTNLVSPEAKGFTVSNWLQANSAALGAGQGCSHFTRALTEVVNNSFGRRLSINDVAVESAKACGVAPVVHMPTGEDENDRPIPRLPDSATMIPLGDVRELPPVPVAPVPVLPAPEPVVVAPAPEPVIKTDHKLPRGVGYALTGTGLALTGVAGYELVRFGDAVAARNATDNTTDYETYTRQANAAMTGAGVLGALGVVGIAGGLVITF